PGIVEIDPVGRLARPVLAIIMEVGFARCFDSRARGGIEAVGLVRRRQSRIVARLRFGQHEMLAARRRQRGAAPRTRPAVAAGGLEAEQLGIEALGRRRVADLYDDIADALDRLIEVLSHGVRHREAPNRCRGNAASRMPAYLLRAA